MQPLAKNHRRTAKISAFTLAEVLIASTLTVMVMSGVMSSVVMTMRTGYHVGQYTDMEDQSRQSLEIFGRDVRMAKSVTWVSANSIDLTLPTSTEGNGTVVYTYTYNPVTKEFWRTANGRSQRLISGVDSLEIHGYQLTGEPVFTADHMPANAFDWIVAGSSTKQIELSVSSSRQQGRNINTAQKIISARFILRNKQTS